MIVRRYEPSDRPALLDVAASAGVHFTDPDNRVAFVAEEGGRAIAGMVALHTAEVALMMDPAHGTELRRLHTLKSLWPSFARATHARGADSMLVPLASELGTMANGLVLSRYGFRRDTRVHLTFDLVDAFGKGEPRG